MTEIFAFPDSWRWLDRPPMRLETGLAGHVVIVLYWRLGCLHSRVALRELAAITATTEGRPIAIIAVHVATCDEERDRDRLRRESLQMPSCITFVEQSEPGDLRRLPSMLLLDPMMVIRARTVGIPRRNRLRAAIEMLAAEAQRSGQLAKVPYVPLQAVRAARLLPTAVVAFGERVWVASAGRHQVLAFDGEGNLCNVIGSGQVGDEDGAPEQASFSLPFALCIHEQYLVVADASTNTVRAIDRSSGEVSTWCGTGQLGFDDMGGSYGRDQALSSPAGMISHDGGLYICQSGTDQIWQIDPMTGAAMAWLGGNAADYSGDHYPAGEDAFREPLGLAVSGEALWVVEGRGHQLSVVDLGHVQRSVVNDSFRRPVAVAAHGERVLVVDSWQGAVFVVTANDGQAVQLFGRAQGLVEPVSIAVDGDRVLIADIGADCIFVSDLSVAKPALSRLPLTGLPAAELGAAAGSILARACSIREHSDVTLRVAVAGHEDETEVAVDVVDEASPVLACARHQVAKVVDGAIEILLPVADAGQGVLRIRLRLPGEDRHYVLPASVCAGGDLDTVLMMPS